MVFNKKNKEIQNPSIVLNPGIEQDEFSSQIYNQQQQFQQPTQQNQPQQFSQQQTPIQQQFQQPVQQTQAQKPETKSVITKVELIDGLIHFEGQANYLINLGDCQIN